MTEKLKASIVSIKTPPFWFGKPEILFYQVEAQLKTCHITSKETMFCYLVTELEPKVLDDIWDILKDPKPNKYSAAKKRLLKIFVEIESKKVCSIRKGSADEKGTVRSRKPRPENSNFCSRVEKKFGEIDPIVRQVTMPSTSESDPWKDESARKDQLADSESDDGKAFRLQLKLSKTRVSTVLNELHDNPTGKHFGVMKTLQKVRERFYRKNVWSDVKKWCRICDPCATRKGPRKHTIGRLQLYNVGAPFERIAFDILGPLPRSSDGNKNILVVMDYFTDWPEACPISDQEASTVAEVLVQHWISRYGVPLQLYSNQKSNQGETSILQLARDCVRYSASTKLKQQLYILSLTAWYRGSIGQS
ncbi:retrovirus-related Pol polyprotein from transposon 412 [Trichonephila clavipes]|nr:retrovirus-related Pol polyprotein from transposon 412 [Trichonephila clavipes]